MDVDDVRAFWEANPLFTGESVFAPGTREFFEEHFQVTVEDCFAGELDPRVFPSATNAARVLDLGCGPGTWVIELKRRGARAVVAADLTERALELTRRRAEVYGVDIQTSRQNAEALTFESGSFSHVNCNGVIHHTPDTEACVREIARVLRPNGTAVIAVYYRNLLVRHWSWLRHAGRLVASLGGGLRGRGRENIFRISSGDEIVRYYDGAANPVGKAYGRREFVDLLSPHFHVQAVFLHFFPARALPVRIPRRLHRYLDRTMGFMIYARCEKR